jgi:hypothetical protein
MLVGRFGFSWRAVSLGEAAVVVWRAVSFGEAAVVVWRAVSFGEAAVVVWRAVSFGEAAVVLLCFGCRLPVSFLPLCVLVYMERCAVGPRPQGLLERPGEDFFLFYLVWGAVGGWP